MIFVGIDPGKDGAVVAIGEDRQVIGSWLAADSFTIKVTKGGKRNYLEKNMANIIADLLAMGPILTVLEKQQARPGQGSTSMFQTGMGYGLWRGILGALAAPADIVHPKTWQKRVLRDAPGDSKGRAIMVCSQRLPELNLTPGKRRKPHDGLADAGCMALYAYSEQTGLTTIL
jgi:crossover junction endodeoxyribonuclease RuvC